MKTTYILLENSQVMAFEGPKEPNEKDFKQVHEMETSRASRLPAVNFEKLIGYTSSSGSVYIYDRLEELKPGEVVALPGWELEKVAHYYEKNKGECGITMCYSQDENVKDKCLKWCHPAYHLKRSEPVKELPAEKHDPNGFNGEYIGDLVMDPETKDLKIVATKVDAVEHKTPDQNDFETEEDFFKACRDKRLNTDTQESQVELFKELFEDWETISWTTKLASQELPKKWFLTRKA
jgi:hypothetical protein